MLKRIPHSKNWSIRETAQPACIVKTSKLQIIFRFNNELNLWSQTHTHTRCGPGEVLKAHEVVLLVKMLSVYTAIHLQGVKGRTKLREIKVFLQYSTIPPTIFTIAIQFHPAVSH